MALNQLITSSRRGGFCSKPPKNKGLPRVQKHLKTLCQQPLFGDKDYTLDYNTVNLLYYADLVLFSFDHFPVTVQEATLITQNGKHLFPPSWYIPEIGILCVLAHLSNISHAA